MRASKETLTLWADERLEEELLKRFSGSGRVVGWRLLRFHVKRLAWGSVIAGALGLKRQVVAINVDAIDYLELLLIPLAGGADDRDFVASIT